MQRFKKYLNPLYRDLDKISDFSEIQIDNELEKEEYPNLEQIVRKKANEVSGLLPRVDKLEQEIEDQILAVQSESSLDDRADAQKHYNELLKQMQLLVKRINREIISVDSPYFGKIQYLSKESRTGRPMNLYIGKIAIVDDQTQLPMVTDWRAPIANLYYQNSGPKKDVKFIAPVGERTGDLLQKRQFQISRGRIRGIYDAKSGNAAADEFLLSQLNERIGKKLQDIVSTIQSQQNEIIREEINKPVLIQGVAGSGKTTIILHRLAYLFFTYKEKIRAESSLIIAPNQMFIDYVSDVLPNLGVESVPTVTYLFWAKQILKADDNFVLSTEQENLDIKRYKGSQEFINLLDKYFETYEEDLLHNIPYPRKELIIRRYYELKEQFKDIDMEERLKLSLEYAFAQKQFQDRKDGIYMQSRDFDKTKQKEILDYFKKNCNPLRLYRDLFKTNLVSKEIAKYSLKGLSKSGKIQHYRIEDLAPTKRISKILYL
jgi:DNA helicase-2/ATP-dependent DNA helicase PcrA